jgi:fatty acid desaturase
MNSKHPRQPRWALQCARAGKHFHIKKQKPLPHNLLNITAAFVLWSTIVSVLYFVPLLSPWKAVPIGGLLIGCCFFGHFILIIHECSHNMFVLGKKNSQTKKLNHYVGRLASIPFFTAYVNHWEKGHVTHHSRPCEAEDPQNPDPLDGKRLIVRLAKLWLIPFGFMPYNPSSQYSGKIIRISVGLVFWFPILYILFQYNWTTLPILYVAFAMVSTLNLLKIAQEHGSGLSTEFDPLLRSRTYFYPFQWLFSPFNINYHFEHHANYNVPWYLLPKYHKFIQDIVPNDLKPFYFHKEYLSQMLGVKELPDIEVQQ